MDNSVGPSVRETDDLPKNEATYTTLTPLDPGMSRGGSPEPDIRHPWTGSVNLG
jgi:hypothetical protein